MCDRGMFHVHLCFVYQMIYLIAFKSIALFFLGLVIIAMIGEGCFIPYMTWFFLEFTFNDIAQGCLFAHLCFSRGDYSQNTKFVYVFRALNSNLLFWSLITLRFWWEWTTRKNVKYNPNRFRIDQYIGPFFCYVMLQQKEANIFV